MARSSRVHNVKNSQFAILLHPDYRYIIKILKIRDRFDINDLSELIFQ